jgi:hypothetical protein
MIQDYFKALTKRTITLTDDGGGGYSETATDITVYGYISELSGREQMTSQRMAVQATSQLQTDTTFNIKDRVVDTNGYFSPAGTIFEIVLTHNNPHTTTKHYDLKQAQS